MGEGWALITLLLALTAFVQSRNVWSIEDDANVIHKKNYWINQKFFHISLFQGRIEATLNIFIILKILSYELEFKDIIVAWMKSWINVYVNGIIKCDVIVDKHDWNFYFQSNL